jgi:hypothetical protein
MPEPSRRFPAPWRADKIPGGYVVRDANGQTLAFVYSRENDGEARRNRAHAYCALIRFSSSASIAASILLLTALSRARTSASGFSLD